MKDAYVVLDYSALEAEMTDIMTSDLRGYVASKANAYHSTKYLSAYRTAETVGFVCDMNQPLGSLYKAGQFIRARLASLRTSQVKILVAGHGQFNENRGIVQGGASGTKVGVKNEQIADHIHRLTGLLKDQWIQWSISLCVCFAGRPKTGYDARVSNDSLMEDSMAGQLAQALQSKLSDFTLKANFTSVSVGDSGHLKAHLERGQLRKFQLLAQEANARSRYERGFAFWSNTTGEASIGVWSMCFSLAYAAKEKAITDENVMSPPVQMALHEVFLNLAAELAQDDKAFAESLERHRESLEEILNYRLVDVRVESHLSESVERANKVVWTCVKGQLSHTIFLPEPA